MSQVSQLTADLDVEARGTTVHLLKSGSKPITDRAPRKRYNLGQFPMPPPGGEPGQQKEASNDKPDDDGFTDVTSKVKFGKRTRHPNPDYQQKP